MNFSKLVIKEISFRKLNFGLSILSATVAAGCLIGALTFLSAHKIRTEEIINQKEIETKKRVTKLEDDYRKITKKMGFNILILPKDQNLNDFYADDFASKYMPENYVDKLANSKIVTIRHLLPSLQQKLKWPEEKRTIILIGMRSEVPNVFKSPLKPLAQIVNHDEIVLGHELSSSLNISTGDVVTLLGKSFKVSKLHGERGNKDDITAWINLKDAQLLLKKENKINAILALECKCAWASLSTVRDEISEVLPDTQTLESHGKALARAEARERAAKEAVDALAAIKHHRAVMLAEQQDFVSKLVPVVIVVCAVWIGVLAFGNSRDRRYEIGVLRALGVSSKNIFFLFLTKAALIGLVGAVLGCCLGFFVGFLIVSNNYQNLFLFELLKLNPLVFTLVGATFLSVAATWLPAIIASHQDPAEILREE